ncbi:hypothetical protein [Bacillus sp. S10(2024)]
MQKHIIFYNQERFREKLHGLSLIEHRKRTVV